MSLEYKVYVSGEEIKNTNIEKVISDHLKNKNISIEERVLKEVAMSIMKYIYKLNKQA